MCLPYVFQSVLCLFCESNFKSKRLHELSESLEGLHLSTALFTLIWFIIYLLLELDQVIGDLNYIYCYTLPWIMCSPFFTSFSGSII